MIVHQTKISDVYLVEQEPREDERGYFSRIFCKDELAKVGVKFDVVQASRSFTKDKGAIRGLHFQKEPKSEDKIVMCLRGKIYDVVVDLRRDSPTFGKWIVEKLSEENKKMLLIPKGCAHGFQVLVDNTELLYLMSEFYSPEHAAGIRWDDPELRIPWPIRNPILSERDKKWPFLKDAI